MPSLDAWASGSSVAGLRRLWEEPDPAAQRPPTKLRSVSMPRILRDFLLQFSSAALVVGWRSGRGSGRRWGWRRYGGAAPRGGAVTLAAGDPGPVALPIHAFRG